MNPTKSMIGASEHGKHGWNHIPKNPLPSLPVPACKNPSRSMTSTIDEAWDDLKSSETAKTRAHASRVSRILNGSSRQAKSRSMRGNPSGIQRKDRTEALSSADLESKVLESPASAFEQVDGVRLRQPLGEEVDESITFAGTRSVHDVASALLASWQKNRNGAADCDVAVRKVALQRLNQDLHAVVKQAHELPEDKECAPSADPPERSISFLEELMTLLMDNLAKVVLKGVADPAEACREASIRAVTLFVANVPDLTPHLAYLFPVLMARGVPTGSMYDPELELFAHDNKEHEAYKRGKATERQDQHVPLVHHVAEGSEELRLSLCGMVGGMLAGLMNRGTIGVLRPYLDDTILFLVSQCKDPYSTVKVEALAIITKLAVHPHLEQGMKFYAVGLSRAILPHLRHRHAKVRLAAIEALRTTVKVPDRAKVKGAGTSAIVDLVGFREDNVLPVAAFYGRGDTTVNYLAELTTDRSVSVRMKTTAMLGDWLTSLPDRYDHHTRLLPYVLNAIADEAKVVSAIAVDTLSKCGAEYEREHQDDVIERRQFGVDGDVRANHSKPLPPPFSGRPRIGARLYVRSNTRRFLLPLLVEMSDWISRTRLQSALLFRTLVVYCEEHLTVEIHKLIPHIQRALHLATSAKDTLLENVLLECCELVGRYIVPDSYLPHMLSRIREEPEVNPTGNRTTLLLILSKLVEGAVPKVLVLHTPEIVDAVTARYEDIEEETAPVRRASIKVLSVIATSIKSRGRLAVEGAAFTGTGRLASLERPMRSAVAYILACRRLENLPFEIDECLSNLAMAFDFVDTEALITAYAGNLVEDACNDYPIGPVWNRTCCPQLVLETLLWMCPQAPRTCPEVSTHLLCLCEQVVSKLSNFPECSQEAVVMALISPLVLRLVTVWECVEDPAHTPKSVLVYNKFMEENSRQLLDLGLDVGWRNTPNLRRCSLEMIVAFTENTAWRKFLSKCPSTARAAATDIMEAVLGHLDCPQISSEDSCKALSVVSRILHTFGLKQCGQQAYTPRLKSFSRRKSGASSMSPSDGVDCSALAADAYPSVVGKLDHSSENVRLLALETLGEFLPFVQPDGDDNQRQRSKVAKEPVGEELLDKNVTPTAIDGARTTLLFGRFVHQCVMHAVVATLTPECNAELDTILRRAACLDPDIFASVLSRVSESSSLTRPARQLLSDLTDHANVVSTLGRGA